MNRLDEKVIIVTGSCTGIGKAIARRCVAEGAQVVIHGLEKEWGDALVEELGSDKAVLHIEDLTTQGCTKRLVSTATAKFGRLDAVVNNAAYIAFGNIHDTDEAEFEKVLAVNTIAPFSLIKAALPELSKTKGCVLNIGSVNAHCGEPNLVAYSPSKGALMTLTRNLGDTLFRENGIRVNQINPGWVLTENEANRKREHGLNEDWYKEVPTMFAPSRRLIAPVEIANAAIFWLSNESGPVSGQVMELEQYPLLGRNPPKDSSTIN
jgi:NAD(P)-dependent dehydrogenase (short-subunit alcohol dehydrogenase family)